MPQPCIAVAVVAVMLHCGVPSQQPVMGQSLLQHLVMQHASKTLHIMQVHDIAMGR